MNDVRVVDDLESLFRAHHGRLVRALTVACGDEQRAAEAVQQAFVKAHLRWRSIMHYDDPVAWIRRVAINEMRDEHRKDVRKRRIVERLAAEPQADVVQEPTAGATTAAVGALLAGLPRQQRLSLALYYVDGLPIAEIADTLGISTGTVKFHLHQGRISLRGQVASADRASADSESGDTAAADTGDSESGDTAAADTGEADRGEADSGDSAAAGDLDHCRPSADVLSESSSGAGGGYGNA